MNKTNNFNLTQREEDVLELLLKGHSNTKIAKTLSISIHTVKAHVESIYRKFGVHNKVQAAIFTVVNQVINVNTTEF